MSGLPLSNDLRNTLVCLCLSAGSLSAQAGAILAGSVSDESNKPVASAFIIATRDSLPPASGRATSAPDGTFRISGLPAGSYSVCVQVAGSAFLDTCEWATSPLRIEVKAGQTAAGLQVKLKKGAILQVRLNDPGKLLEPLSTKTIPHVLMAVQTPRGLLHHVTLLSKDAGGATHGVTVPFDTAFKFTIFSPHISLADEKGMPVGPAGSKVSVTVPSGTNAKPLTFNVTGPK